MRLSPRLLSLVTALVVGLAGSSAVHGRDDAAPPPAPPLVTEAVLSAAPGEVWKIFATAEGWTRLGVAQAEVALRVGGVIRTTYDPQGALGDDGTIEHTVLAFEPERMLALRVTRAPKDVPFPPETVAATWSVLHLTDLGDGRTRLSLHGYGIASDAASMRMRAFFEQGNAATLKRLAAHFASQPSAATAPDPATSPIELEQLVAATPAQAFAAFTTPEGVTAFLGVTARVELAHGGPFELEFAAAAPAGSRGSEGCRVLSWLPGRMLSFDWNAPPHLPHARAGRTVVVVEFEAEGPGRTRVRLTHHGFASKAAAEPDHAAEWKRARAYFATAWPSVLDALRVHFAGR